MKDIKTKINEGWEFTSHLSDTMGEELDIPKSAKWLLINTEGEMISAVTAKDLNSFISDFDADPEDIAKIKKLKIGESYDADGGINIYIRIKK